MLVGCWGRAAVGAIGGLNQVLMRSVLAYSSFIHVRWAYASVVESMDLFNFYFLGYVIQLGLVNGACYLGERKSLEKGARSLLGAFRLISMRGLPPFAGFCFKLVVLLGVDLKRVFVFILFTEALAMKFYLDFRCAIMIERWANMGVKILFL